MRLVKRLSQINLVGQIWARTPPSLVAGTAAALRFGTAVARRPIRLRRYDLSAPDGRPPGRLIVADHGLRVAELLQDEWDGIASSGRHVARLLWPGVPGALDRLAPHADLVVARFHARLGRRRFDDRYIRVPEAVDSRAAVPADGSIPPQARRGQGGNLRVLRKANLRWELSHRPEDFARFYHDMYVPFTRARFGEFADVRSFQYVRTGFLRGGLMWILDGDIPVAGAIYSIEDGALVSWVGGTAGGDINLLKRGVAPAMDVFSFQLARELGVDEYDMAMSRPVLNDGVLAYKKRWGAAVRGGQLTYCNFYLRWDRFNRHVARILARTPLLIHDGDKLSGLVVRDEPFAHDQLDRLAVEFAMPGIRRLYVMLPDLDEPRRPQLTDPRVRELDLRLLPGVSSQRFTRMMSTLDESPTASEPPRPAAPHAAPRGEPLSM
ncbi:MAG: hypothetical protein WD009_07275 [Phycisphaeraceae bacterium]